MENKQLVYLAIGGGVLWLAVRALQGKALVMSHTMATTDASGVTEVTDYEHTLLPPTIRRPMPPTFALGASGAAPPDVSSPVNRPTTSDGAAVIPFAAAPGVAPFAMNPSVAGPVIAPDGFAPIPAYSDPVAADSSGPSIDPGLIRITDPQVYEPLPAPPVTVTVYDPAPDATAAAPGDPSTTSNDRQEAMI